MKRKSIPQFELPGTESAFNLAQEVARQALPKPEPHIECQGMELFTTETCPHGHPIQDCNCKDETFPAYEHADSIPLG